MAKKSLTTSTPVPGYALSALELRIAADFLGKAAEGYVDHSANEFDLPDTPVRRDIVKSAEKLYASFSGNKPDEVATGNGQIYATDYVLFHYFAQRWNWLAHQLDHGKTTESLAKEEFLTGSSLLELLSRNDYEEYAQPKDDPDHSLPPTPEGRQLAEAVIRHKGVRDADKRVTVALAGEYGCDVHATWLLAYLAERCAAIAKASPAKGWVFEGDYTIAVPIGKAEKRNSGALTDTGTIPTVKRPGISPKWLRTWKSDINAAHQGIANGLPSFFFDSLMEYVKEGFSQPGNPYNLVQLAVATSQYSYNKVELFEQNAIERAHYDVAALASAYSGWRLAALMKVRYWSQANNTRQRLEFSYSLMAAYGAILTIAEDAASMAKVLIHAHRMNLFEYPEFYPASQCILQIFASYIGEPTLRLKGAAASHPIYIPLALHWRHPDAEALTPLLLAACDEHTYRDYSGKPDGCGADFDIFSRTPVEILLIFKLRKLLGLPNPKLDHPLMNTLLGQLPKEMPIATDEVIMAVMKRARAEGFDEKKALSEIEMAAAKVK